MNPRPSLERQLKDISKLETSVLRSQYRRLCGETAPDASRPLLENLVSYRLQKLLIARLRSKLFQILNAAESIQSVVADGSADTILVREWRGVCHAVTVVDDEVMYMGERYPNLSMVARLITGGQRTADQFFGRASHGRR